MKLIKIIKITGTIELLSGLHIGSGNNEMHIGGTDNPVIKHPHSNEPYIPGSSIKGKVRSLLEWHAGLIEYNHGKPIAYKNLNEIKDQDQQKEAKAIIQMFGVSGGDNLDYTQAKEIGPTRLTFRDASLSKDWLEQINNRNLIITETKFENTINRISGTAENPRNTERVPAGASFDFEIQLKVLETDKEQDSLRALLTGLKLLEMDALGGSGSRGYGRVKFKLDGEFAAILDSIDPFNKTDPVNKTKVA